MSEPEKAKEAGILFYELPENLKDEQIDKLILPIVKLINMSKWVWTAESCQGHPDMVEEYESSWGGPEPMLRLVCRRGEYFGLMMTCLIEAIGEYREETGRWTPGILMHLNEVKADWISVLIYIHGARNAFDRNRGLLILERFALLLNVKSAEMHVFEKNEGKTV